MAQSQRLIILDDDFKQGEMLKSYLELVSEYQVDIATCVRDFWELVGRNDYDLVFLDYRLEESNGLEVLATMKRRGIRLPVIMITGEGDERVAVRAIQEGASDYLVKGSDYLPALPGLIQRVIRMFELQSLAERSMEEARYQALLLDNMRDAVVVWDVEGKITYWNLAAEKLFGWKASERLGQSVEECYFGLFDPPIQRPRPDDTAGLEIERACTTRDGRRLWVSSRIMPLRQYGPGVRLLGFMDVTRDVTRRRQEREMLRQSQRFIQQILETSPSLLYLYDIDENRLVYINHRAEDVFGIPANSWIGSEGDMLAHFIHPDDLPRLTQMREALLQAGDGDVLEAEFRLRDAQGTWHWIYTRETVFQRSTENRPIQILGAAQDVTARRKAEEDLQWRAQAERLFAEISSKFINVSQVNLEAEVAESLFLLSKIIRADCVYLYLHHSPGEAGALRRFCVWQSQEDPRPEPAHEVKEEAIPDIWRALSQGEAVQSGPSGHFCEEYRAFREQRITSFLLVPLLHEGRLFGVLGCESGEETSLHHPSHLAIVQAVGRILTNALVQAEFSKALQASEARYRAIVEDHQTELICRFTPDGCLTFVNETFCRYFNQSREQLLGMSWFSLIDGKDQTAVKHWLESLRVDQPVCHYECRVAVGAGEDWGWMEWTSRAIFDAGRVVEIQSIGRDITEKKRLEAQVQAAQLQLAEANRLASIGQLAASVAHLINNPLTAILGEAQLLRQRMGHQSQVRESAEAIERAGWRAQQVVEKLLNFSNQASAAHCLVDVNQTLLQAMELVAEPLSRLGLVPRVKLAESLSPVMANSGQLVDLWVNLLSFALDGLKIGPPPEPRLDVISRQEAGWVIVEVSDNGKMIPVDEIDHIFEPRVIPVGDDRGSGIELALCRELVRQNRGIIEAECTQGETRFRIKFPIDAPSIEARE